MNSLDTKAEARRKHFRQASKDLGEDLDGLIEQLVRSLGGLNPLDLAAHLYLINCTGSADTYAESEHDGNQAYVEYLFQVALTHSRDLFTWDVEKPISARQISETQDLIKRIFELAMFRIMATEAGRAQEGLVTSEPMATTRFRALTNSLFVRNSAYDSHYFATATELHGEVGIDLREVLGFSIADAAALVEAQLFWYEELLNALRDIAVKDVPSIILELEKQEQNRGVPRDRLEAYAIHLAFTVALHDLSTRLSVTSEELAQQADLPEEVAASFLDSFSLDFGSLEAKFYRAPHPASPVTLRPYAKVRREDGSDAYFCTVPSALRAALLPRLEALLNPDRLDHSPNTSTQTWNAYERARSSFTERKALGLLRAMLKPEVIHQGLKYFPEGAQSDAELDGLLLEDGILFLVEVKAGRLQAAAQRAAPKAVLRSLEELVGVAHAQAKRALDYIRSSPNGARFTLSDNSSFNLSPEEVRDVHLITVTLEPLEVFATNMSTLTGLNIVRGPLYPWSIYLEDLRVISDLVETPAQFVHYLRRRDRVNELPMVSAHDELDWFGNYLSSGLFFDDFLSEHNPDLLFLGTFTTDFDKYYGWKQGLRSRREDKPKQDMPDLLRSTIQTLCRRRPDGYLHACALLLDMDQNSRETFVRRQKELVRSVKKTKKIRNFTMGFTTGSQKFGVTLVVSPRSLMPEAERRAQLYTERKPIELGVQHWVTLVSGPKNKMGLRSLFVWRDPSTLFPREVPEGEPGDGL